jgi:putative addiction module component (TIGR02574 family)
MNTDMSHLLQLSAEQRLQLIGDLWDSLANMPEAVPLTDRQKKELARRKAEHLANPQSAVPWEEAMEQIRRGEG